MACPEVWARMAILNKKLKEAEAIYLEQNQLDEALNMYQQFHKWDEGNVFDLIPESLCPLHYICCKCYCVFIMFIELL
jgi:hypothetical protein